MIFNFEETNNISSNFQVNLIESTPLPSPPTLTSQKVENQNQTNTEIYFSQHWSKLKKFLESLYEDKQTASQFSFHELHESVKDLCRNSHQKEIYKNLVQFYSELFKKKYSTLHNKEESECLRQLKLIEENVQINMRIVRQIFIWFESTELIYQRIKNIPNLIYNELAKVYQTEGEIATQLINGAMQIILDKRVGEKIDEVLLKSLMQFFININVYEEIIHPKILKTTRKFYEEQAAERVKEFDICEYLKNVERLVQEERKFVLEFMDKMSEKKVVKIIEHAFISDQLKIIMGNQGLVKLLDGVKYKELNYLFNILQRIQKPGFIKKCWSNYIRTKGQDLLIKESFSISEILSFKERMDIFIKRSFESEDKMIQAMQYAFEDFLNRDPDQIALETSKYLDKYLKSSKNNKTEEVAKKQLENGLTIFKFIQAKDVFQMFYTQRLTKRLILEKSLSRQLENEIIQRFKDECGDIFVKNMEEVEKEILLSEDTTLMFGGYLKKKKIRINIDFKIVIMEQKSWTLNTQTVPHLFGDLKRIKSHFTKFYKKRQGKVLLKWQYDCSETIVEANFDQKVFGNKIHSYFQYTLVLSVLQAVILDLYNKRTEYTFQQLMTLTKFEKQILRNMLVSMSLFSEKLLIKEPQYEKQKLIQPSDKFVLNQSYTSKKLLVKIHTVEKVEKQKHTQDTRKKILKERGYMIDAGLIKILKQKREISEQGLIDVLFEDLELPFEVVEIKKRIEGLIQRDFIRTNEEGKYQYIS